MKQFKQISLLPQDESLAKELADKFKLNLILAKILVARGYQLAGDGSKELEDFLNPTLSKTLLDPKDLKNLNLAAELISKYIINKQKIAICCDFDVDGLSSAAQLKSFLNEVGADSLVQVPDRFADGYGLNTKMIDTAKQFGASLLVTLDYGTTNSKELDYAKSLGLDTIVVDHHHVATNPPADVFVNPEQSGCGFAEGILCTAGLAWYLLIALKKALENHGNQLAKDIDVREYLDLACLGTICDMVPLVGVNRLIAQKGIEYLNISKRAGIKALKRVIGIKSEVLSHHVGFGFGPRINAAGRMMSGEMVVRLLSTRDIAEAQKVAERLNVLNKDRQDIEKKIKAEAEEQVESLTKLPYGICAWGESFHTGVIGIVAQRLTEKFYRPSIVMGLDNGSYKGSVRGIKGFSVVEALTELGDNFTKFGGHPGAGGFTLKHDDPAKFAQDFNQVCEKLLKEVPLIPSVKADTEIQLAEVDEVLCSQVSSLQPFGLGNPGVNLLIKDLVVKDLTCLKNAHLKMTLSDGKRYLTAFLWQTTHHPALFPGAKVNIVGKPEINEYQGNRSVQFNLVAAEVAA